MRQILNMVVVRSTTPERYSKCNGVSTIVQSTNRPGNMKRLVIKHCIQVLVWCTEQRSVKDVSERNLVKAALSLLPEPTSGQTSSITLSELTEVVESVHRSLKIDANQNKIIVWHIDNGRKTTFKQEDLKESVQSAIAEGVERRDTEYVKIQHHHLSM